MTELLTLLKITRDQARSFRQGDRAAVTFAAGFVSCVLGFETVDEFVGDYDDAWKDQAKTAKTAGVRKDLAEARAASGNDPDTKSWKAHNRADAANKTMNKLKGYRSELTACLALVRDVQGEPSKVVWSGVTPDEWAETLAVVKLAGSVENMKNYAKHGGTPDNPNRAPKTNRTATVAVESDDLRDAVALMIAESLDETCSIAAMKVWDHKIAPLVETARERIAAKAN